MPGRSRDFTAKTPLIAVTFALAACGGSQFSATGGSTAGAGADSGNAGTLDGGSDPGGGDSGGAAGGSSTGGSAHGGTTGKGGSGGSAGSGGKPSMTCDCAAGYYCQDGTNKCRACSDFSRLEFAAPVKLATVSQSENGNERFPRPGTTSTDLFYRSGKPGSLQIWYAAAPMSGAGKPILDPSPNPTMIAPAPAPFDDGAPLLAPGEFEQNFFFDRLDPATNSRKLMVAAWPAADLSGATAAPAPINGDGDNFSVAVAPAAQRAYWMSTRNGKGPELVWSAIVAGMPSEPLVLDLNVQVGAKTCPLMADDATPWVNLDGTLLLFRSMTQDNGCTESDSNGYDLYAAPLAKDTGLPVSNGIPLSSLNVIGGGSNETDPSFSADACFIYYASDGGSSDFDIYRAARN